MLTNSMRELTSSRSPGAGELHFLPKLLVQEVASNCELYNTFFLGIRTPDTSSSPRTSIESQNVFSGVTGKFVTY